MRARLAPAWIATSVAILVACTAAAEPQAVQAGAANSSQDCVICHFRWSGGFATASPASLLASRPAETLAASPAMCESCHDGSVMDSRVELFTGRNHLIGEAPPAGMAIPDHFPLDAAGKVRCATCHSPHERPNTVGAGGASKFLRMSNEQSATCRSCHPDKDDVEGLGNHPMGEVDELLPPRLRHGRPDPSADRKRITCQSCHAAHGAPAESLLVNSARTSALCLDCHSDKDHLGPNGRRSRNHVVNVRPKDERTRQALARAEVSVGPDGEVGCTSCHQVHGSQLPKNLAPLWREPGAEACLTCHEAQSSVVGTRHDLALSAPTAKNSAGLVVAEGGTCSACHLPHGAGSELRGRGGYATRRCMGCHAPGGSSPIARLHGQSHPVDVRAPDRRSSSSLPLVNSLGLRSAGGQVSCLTCHDPHGGARGATHFLRRSEPELCRDCHDDAFRVKGSKHDLSRLADSGSKRSASSGTCAACHVVHDAQADRRWNRDLAVGDEHVLDALCTSCHAEGAVAEKKLAGASSHPVGMAVDGDLRADLPLFDAAGGRAGDGVVTCATCHDAHAWTPGRGPATGSQEGDGDATNSFLRVAAAPSSELCVACHASQARILGSDHDLTVTAPASANELGQAPERSGPCGVCHSAHGSSDPKWLWARQPFADRGANAITEWTCTACHAAGGVAQGKRPESMNHPNKQLTTAPGDEAARARFPLFDPQTGERTSIGNMSCVSCHDVHAWDWRSDGPGAGTNLEGDAMSSFLRSESRGLPCAECHGDNSLLLYHYFHARRRSWMESLITGLPESMGRGR